MNKNFGELIGLEQRRVGPWRPWFAWRPVRIDGKWVWWEEILRAKWEVACAASMTYTSGHFYKRSL